MAMYIFFNQNGLVTILIGLLLHLCHNGLITLFATSYTTVDAIVFGNSGISGPFLQIESPQVTRLKITQPHLPHYLPCSATVEVEDTSLLDGKNYLFVWYRNGVRLSTYVGRRSDFQIYANGTLRLPPNEKSHGVFRCMVNALKHAMLSESITVEFPMLKRITVQPNITAIAGMPLTLICPVLSVPQANFTWSYANDSLLKKFKENRYIKLSNGSFIIKNITQEDGGKYKCSAENQFAVKSHRQFVWNVKIVNSSQKLDNSSSLSSLPRFYKAGELIPQLQDSVQYIPRGESLTLRCIGFWETIPIEWWFQRTSSAIAEKIFNNSHQIEIMSATIEKDEGYYTCSTKIDKQTFHVIVTTPPTIETPLQSYESSLAASLTYSCRAYGNPEPEIIWYLNGKVINSTYTRIIKPNSLTIYSFDLEEEGIYQCFARNVAGETYTAGEVRLRRRDDATPNPLTNLRCYAHSFNTINVTFDSGSSPLYFISVHVVQQDPHRWESIGPLRLNHTSYVVISNHLPSYRPFVIITRALLATSLTRSSNKPNEEETILSSLRSMPITCCTQGLLLHLVHFPDDLFITWSQPDIDSKKYFIVQFSINDTRPHPQKFLSTERQLQGTAVLVELNKEDVESKLIDISPLDELHSKEVLKRAQSKYIDNESRNSEPEPEDEIFNIVLRANVTGIMLKNFTRAKVRVLIVTAENEDLQQDFRYVQWKIIENDTAESSNVPFRLTTVESRSISIVFQEIFTEDCVEVCYSISEFPIIRNDHQICEEKSIASQQLVLRSLKPMKRYRMNFFSCQTQIFYGQLDVQTLPDPPGTISNQRVTRHNGLKLSWDPPLNPNGKIHHYNIRWMHNNITHENNVLDCVLCFFKFPNSSETAKINVTVRVVGENGVGAPIYIDLRNIRHEQLEIENSTTKSQVYAGIAIGALLSVICVFVFALIIIWQKRRYKLGQGQAQLTSQSESNFGTISNPATHGDSAGALSTMHHEYHEMQNLIPRSRNFQFLTERCSSEFLNRQATTAMTTTNKQQLPNGNGNCQRQEASYHLGLEVDNSCVELINQNASISVYTSTPVSIANTAKRRRSGSGGVNFLAHWQKETPSRPSLHDESAKSPLPYFIPVLRDNRARSFDSKTSPTELNSLAAVSTHVTTTQSSLNKISSSPSFFNSKNNAVFANKLPAPATNFNNSSCSRRCLQNGNGITVAGTNNSSCSNSSSSSNSNSSTKNIPKHSSLSGIDAVDQQLEADRASMTQATLTSWQRSLSQKSVCVRVPPSMENDHIDGDIEDGSVTFLHQPLASDYHGYNNNNIIHSGSKLENLNNTVLTTITATIRTPPTNSIPAANYSNAAATLLLLKTNSNSKSTIGTNTAATTTATKTTNTTNVTTSSGSNPIQCHSGNSSSGNTNNGSCSNNQEKEQQTTNIISGLVPPNTLAGASTNHQMLKTNWMVVDQQNHHHHQYPNQHHSHHNNHQRPYHQHQHQHHHHHHHHHRRPNVDPNG